MHSAKVINLPSHSAMIHSRWMYKKKSERKMTYLFSRDGVDGGSAVALVCLQPSLLLSFASVPVRFSLPAAPISVLFFCVCFWVFLLSFFPRFCDFFRLFPPVFWFFFWVLLALCFTDFFLFLPPAVHGFFFFPRFCPFFFWFFVPFSIQKSPPLLLSFSGFL